MKLFAIVAVLALLGGACAPGSTSTTPASIPTPSTSTTTPPSTTAPPSSTTLAVDHPELVVDPLVLVTAGEVSTMALSGLVTAGSKVQVLVTRKDGTLASQDDATVEENGDSNAYFQTEVTLASGVNTVAVTATGPQGGTAVVTIEARHEPEATNEFSFLTDVSEATVVADYAQWLTGEEAYQAAYEDGVIESIEEGVPNDYYIRNQNRRLRTLNLADDVRIWLNTAATGPVTSIEVSLAQWLGLFNNGLPWDPETDETPPSDGPHFDYFGAGWVQAPYWLTILNGEVIAIVHQYTP